MKKLILPLIFLSFSTWSRDEIPSVSDTAIKNKFMTTVKDVEVEKLLGASAEFNDCREKNKFDPKDDSTKRNAKLKAATDCFKEKVGKKDPAALKKLAEDLKLQNYGLIKSKSVNDITLYLSKKMTKSLTGRDPDDKSFESLKFENIKIVDQKVFIDLYTNQLVKSALFEVSRFCFENLRKTDSTAKTTKLDFASHWGGITKDQIPVLKDIDDSGIPKFVQDFNGVDMTKQEDVYKHITTGLGQKQLNADDYGNFFGYCQKSLMLLCNEFKSKVSAQTKGTDASGQQVDQSIIKDNYQPQGMSYGASACLTIDRLQSIRTAMTNTEKVAKQFDEMADKNAFALQLLKNPKLYQRGKGAGEESLDELSSLSSTDMLADAKDEFSDLEKKCTQGNSDPECDKFLIEGDELSKSIHNVESELNLKREIELERVRKLKNDTKGLEEYLTENGHFELLEKIKNPPAGFDIETEIGNIYDARKVAEIEALKLKVGKRQVTDTEMKDLEAKDLKDDRIKENIQESKEERARLAQVVLFNNIITSQLTLTDKNTKKDVGRNVNAWKKEYESFKSAGINTDLFEGIQESAEKSGSKLEDTSVVGGGIIDTILGKKPEK